ncbi:MAG: carboxymuconolactone decarboxylase family protein [Acidiferrobacterales bacterium]
MDKQMIELIAIGASAAVNCRPCMEHHSELGRKLGVSREQLRAAVEVGMKVNQGAANKTAHYVAELFGEERQSMQTKGCCG